MELPQKFINMKNPLGAQDNKDKKKSKGKLYYSFNYYSYNRYLLVYFYQTGLKLLLRLFRLYSPQFVDIYVRLTPWAHATNVKEPSLEQHFF